jgi:methyl-accepting chemotaxis protein
VLDHIGTPLFGLDTDRNIVKWNNQIEKLTGVAEAEAKSMEMASMAFYPDGRRGKTLADKVVDALEDIAEAVENVQQHANTAEQATAEIVEATETQTEAVTDLAELVEQLVQRADGQNAAEIVNLEDTDLGSELDH